MADTIGDLIDKLTISNIRLWMLEDERRSYCLSDESRNENEIKEFLNKISLTNRERNNLIDQINASMTVLIDKTVDKDSTVSLTFEELLGTGKNKFYKGEDK
jgi:hypothetical protein|tara:strand:+ start:418 stop:723 length:306 start_codon:yes stop_codon:yes gene_type:complete